jgi:Holliday junction DNA helicase RuvA
VIASLYGKLQSLSSEWAIIDVGGIGFQVFMPTSTLSTLGAIGNYVKLYTHLHLREDNIALYGFTSADELRLFETITTVSGIGPKLALAMLSTLSVEQIIMAIATASADVLAMTPGVGKKTASRIILELKETIGAGWVITPTTQLAQENSDVLAALTALGYSNAEATRAVATLPPSPKLSLEEKIKLALQYFGGKK